MTDTTPQLAAWRGEFGNAYIARNEATQSALQARTRAWSRILDAFRSPRPNSILEVGANIGLNLRALSGLTSADLWGLEPNANARARLAAEKVVAPERVVDGIGQSIPLPDASIDLVFTSGVLIHVPPADLKQVCQEIHRVSRRYIMVMEYFADHPVSISYRGNEDLLFKRDFGGFFMENFPDLRLLDYGFFWKPVTDLDNMTWWAFEKS